MQDWPDREHYTAEDLVQIIRILRDPETGCPWDKVQTHASIRKNGMLIWEESFPDTTQKYSITRKTDSISPYFLMNLGNRTYVARYDKDGKMEVRELRTDVRKSDIRPEA